MVKQQANPEVSAPGFWDALRSERTNMLTSFCLHALLVILLGMILLPMRNTAPLGLRIDYSLKTSIEEDLLDASPDELAVDDVMLSDSTLVDELELAKTLSEPIKVDVENPVARVSDSHASGLPTSELSPTGGVMGPGEPGQIAGREGRRAHAQAMGASAGSEEAVDRALDWLARHQNSNGSWSFNLRKGTHGKCTCSQSGTAERAVNGATAIGLLPFLGAGNTSLHGEYRSNVARASQFLLSRQGSDGGFIELDGTMYSHGLAALALCELYAMEKDSDRYRKTDRGRRDRVGGSAQQALYFIVKAQHADGGWRYAPKQPGDTSVVGWQAMALQSGRMAGLSVPNETFSGIDRFLDSVSGDTYGASYGYMSSTPRPSTTAIGLLCRMYGGWDRGHPGTVNGIDNLVQQGPSSNNVYYDYYATQVMHHYQGPDWERWNTTLRDHLVQTQVKEGHEAGSWYFDGDFGSASGGRLYITAMATMILEVYYRHMPIYGETAVAAR